MDANTASEIAENLGAYVKFNETIKLYAVYFGEGWCYLRPKDLEKANEDEFKMFIMGIIAHEAEAIERYGVTKH